MHKQLMYLFVYLWSFTTSQVYVRERDTLICQIKRIDHTEDRVASTYLFSQMEVKQGMRNHTESVTPGTRSVDRGKVTNESKELTMNY